MKLANLFSVRKVLSFLLVLSVVYAAYSIYYKVKYWGFSLSPKQVTDIWTIDAKVSFDALGEDVRVSLGVPADNESFKVLSEEVVAKNYDVVRDKAKNRLVMQGRNKEGKQKLYYRLNIYDDVKNNAINKSKPAKVERPLLSEEEQIQMNKLWELAKNQEGDKVQGVIAAVNQEMTEPTMSLVLPLNHTSKEFAEKIIQILAYKRIPARIARALKLEEGKKNDSLSIMVEAYVNNKWTLYDLSTAKIGLPENWVVFQRGGVSLLDVRGGENSKVMFSVLKSVATPLKMAEHRAKANNELWGYEYSIYTLPLMEQNALKWLMIFPLAILVVVIMRNVIGVTTMGTFTPMLLAMSLVKTGFVPGLICFSLMLGLGLIMRAVVARLNLLLVPRISFVVIFVILLIQILAVIGYKLNYGIISSAIFFPIIITAWIIERASITWEEEGAVNTLKEIFYTLVTAVVTYFVISSDYVRHIMFAFNELNLVILFIVMLLGTYTGYRLTELSRFAPLIRKGE
ncbi:MAG: UUP1 family membrane protein [Alphaproteobacteria bacterium]|nr:UUP1 family membrane protein [Alphaproteobacteria bacterium]